ncbi:MAG TPA: DUF882 domain-containing protein [Gammaproteobacteria bacterium]
MLVACGALAALCTTAPALALARVAPQRERRLVLRQLHTGEVLRTTFWADGDYVPDALAEISHLLRDHRTGEVQPIDRDLLDLLARLSQRLESRGEFHVISGYRSPKTNEALRRSGGGGVARRSLHMDGRAIDIRVPGRDLAQVRQAALALRGGGVGYYPNSRFIHLDTGRVRSW